MLVYNKHELHVNFTWHLEKTEKPSRFSRSCKLRKSKTSTICDEINIVCWQCLRTTYMIFVSSSCFLWRSGVHRTLVFITLHVFFFFYFAQILVQNDHIKINNDIIWFTQFAKFIYVIPFVQSPIPSFMYYSRGILHFLSIFFP